MKAPVERRGAVRARRALALAGLATLGGCPDRAPAQPTPPAGTAPGSALPAGSSAAAPSASAPATPAPVGGACSAPGAQGECMAGHLCMPMPGGYCTGFCGPDGGCGDGARCTPTVRAGELCLAACATDADCRQGYGCDPAWQVCMRPGFIGPKPPACAPGPRPKPRTSFSMPQLLSKGRTSRYSFEPAATLLPSGEVAVVYTAMNGMLDDNGLETTVLHTDGSFDAPRPFASPKKRHFDPWLTTWNGKAVLVWLGHDGGSPDQNVAIGMATSADGVTWSAPIDVLDTKQDCPDAMRGCADKPMVATSGKKGAPLVVFYYSEATEGLRARVSGDGATFAPSVPVAEGAYGHVSADPAGTLRLVAGATLPGDGPVDRFGDRRTFVALTESTDGGSSWSKPERASAEGAAVPFYFSNPQVLADPQRKRVYVLYPTGTPDGAWDIVLASRPTTGGAWSFTRVNDDAHCASHMKPSAVLDPVMGGVHVVWTENRGGIGRVVYAACTPYGDQVRCGQNEQVSDDFAAYSFVRHARTWLGEYDALVFDAARRALHVVYTATALEDGRATSRV
ncbi:MAG: exo-alpha-sialidase, partial [Polyangiaceae bacterium]|nr:exo-alpha-sialidase [Polyangiaceae bacterium]